MSRFRILAVAFLGPPLAAPAHAKEPPSQETFRSDSLSGDLALQLDVGGAAANSRIGGYASFAARYLLTAGIYTTFIDDFSASASSSSRSGSLGVELRPLYLVRLAKDWERGPPTLDLAVDSVGLRLGAVVSRQRGYDWSAPGLEIGLAWGVPLTSQAAGPWIDACASIRMSHPLLAGHAESNTDTIALLALTIGYQTILNAHLIDAGDRVVR